MDDVAVFAATNHDMPAKKLEAGILAQLGDKQSWIDSDHNPELIAGDVADKAPALHQFGRLKNQGYTQWEWHTVSDDRVCSICGPRNGKHYSVKDEPFAPGHVRCRCSAHPYGDPVELDGKDPLAGRIIEQRNWDATKWEKTKPWDASEADIKAGKVKGFVFDPQLPKNVVAANHTGLDGNIHVGQAMFKSTDNRQVFYHEAGHDTARLLVAEKKHLSLLENAGNGRYKNNPWGGDENMEETISDAYSILATRTVNFPARPWAGDKMAGIEDLKDAATRAQAEALLEIGKAARRLKLPLTKEADEAIDFYAANL